MKKTMFVLIAAAGCITATAQNPPDTSNRFNNNPYPPDTTLVAPPVAPVVTPSITTLPDSMLVPQSQPVNTDVRNNGPITDTASLQTTNQLPAGSDSSNTTIPVVPLPSADSMRIDQTTPQNSSSTAPAAVVPAQTDSMSSTRDIQQMNAVSTSDYSMPRGVNNPDASFTGLNKWSALPVLNTYVPQDVVDQMRSAYGDKLYDITMLKTGENQYGYSARVQENGVYKSIVTNANNTNN